jgi:hypothetical protein
MVLSRALVAFDERRADPTTNLGTLGAAGNVAYTGTVRLAGVSSACVRFPGNATGLTIPDAANLTPTTSLSVRAAVALNDWTAINELAAHYSTSGNNRSWLAEVTATGNLALRLSTSGATDITLTSTAVPVVADGALLAVRHDWTASPAEVRFFTKTVTEANADAECLSDTGWTQLGTTITTSVPSTALFNSAQLGIFGGGASAFMAGRMHSVVVKVDGSTVVDVDTSVLTDEGATSFLARTGQTVTINRSTGATYKTEVVVPGTGSRLFNGTSDFGEVADLAGLDFGASDSFTVFALVRQWNTAAVNARYISKRSGSGTGYVLAAFSSTAAQAYVQGAAGSSFITTNLAVAGQMTMLALARPASGAAMRIHMNGTEASAADTSTDLANSNPLTIGADPGGANRGFFRLYAWGVFPGALTSAQLTALRAALTSSDPGDGPRTATLTVPRRNLEISA